MTNLRIAYEEMESFIPHQGTMCLLSGIVDWSDDFQNLSCSALADEDSPFMDEELGGIPVAVAFEYMAQSVAALSGLERHLKGDSEPRVGYIIGVRGFAAETDYLPLDDELLISVHELFRDGPVVSFRCEMTRGDNLVARGNINAYEPEREKA